MVAWRSPPFSPVDRLLELTYRAEQSHFWFRGFRQYMQPALARATAGVSSPRILDCGCGTGSNLEMLRPYGRAVGFDLTGIGPAFARSHGHRVAQAEPQPPKGVGQPVEAQVVLAPGPGPELVGQRQLVAPLLDPLQQRVHEDPRSLPPAPRAGTAAN